MAAAVGGTPLHGGPWSGSCRLGGLPDGDPPGLGSLPPSHGEALPPAAPFAGLGTAMHTTGSPIFHNVVPSMNAGSSAPKGLEQPSMPNGGSMGEVGMRVDPAETAPVESWMMMSQQPVQQQFYYDDQPTVQQQMQQQRPQGMSQGPHGREAPAVGLGDGSQWAPQMEYTTDGSGEFGYGSTCMLPAQAPPTYGVSPISSGDFVGEAPMAAQPHLSAWKPGAAGQQEAMQGSGSAAPPFGMCMSASPGQQGRLGGGPEAPGGAGPWYPMQPQPLGVPAAPSTGYRAMPEAPSPHPNSEMKVSKQSNSGGARRRGDSTADGAPTPAAGHCSMRPAKFFKQHSPAKAAPKTKTKAGGPQGTPLGEGGFKGPADGSVGCTGPAGQAGVGTPVGAGHKQAPGSNDGRDGEIPPPKPAPRSRAVRPSEVMAKMYFHRKKEAWRAELLIEGTKKQKSFSCRLYGYERARLMCEWARKFVLRTSRLPTDEETCISVASLMKEPLPSQVPSGPPYLSESYAGTAGSPQGPFARVADTSGSLQLTKGKNLPLSSEPQPAAMGAMGAGGPAVEDGSQATHSPVSTGVKGPHEPQGTALCKKRKEPTKTGETATRARKGNGAQGGAATKKNQAPRGNCERPGDSAFMGPHMTEETEMLAAGGTARPRGPGECRGDTPQQMISSYFAFASGECGTSPCGGFAPVCGSSEVQDLSQAGPPLPQREEGLSGPPQEEEARGGMAEPRTGEGELRTQEPNPWFEELEQLKKISRPKGGRAKRFNVGKKPFSGVRGIYFQQGLWKVKYRGDQEEAMKLFPYSPGDEKDMKSQFELARSFLRQVIDKGRHLHDSDGEGLSEDEPAWIVRGTSASKWTYRKETQPSSCKIEQPQRFKPPNAAASRRRAPASCKGPRLSVSNETPRGGALSITEDWQSPASASNYFGQGPPVQANEAFLSKGLPFSAVGITFPPQASGAPSSLPQATVAGGQAGEFQMDAGCGQLTTGGPQRCNPWGHTADFGETKPAAGRAGELRLPMVPCGGVFTTADSPMSQRVSPSGKSAFPQDGVTGFSAVTTTADEVNPPEAFRSTWGPNEVNNPALVVVAHPKATSARYAQNYFCGPMITTQTEDKVSTAASCTSFHVEGIPPLHRSLNLNEHTPEMSMASSRFMTQPEIQPSNAMPGTSHFPQNAAAASVPSFQTSEGISKGADCSLQLRIFPSQHTGHLETSLGEELLSVSSYPCSFGGSIGGCQSPPQQLGREAPTFAHMEANGGLAVEHAHQIGTGGAHSLNPQFVPWSLDSPLAFHKPKEEALSGESAARPEMLGYGGSPEAPSEAEAPCRVAALPWVVVRPSEEDEKALTPIAGKAVGCLLQGGPDGSKYIQQHAN